MAEQTNPSPGDNFPPLAGPALRQEALRAVKRNSAELGVPIKYRNGKNIPVQTRAELILENADISRRLMDMQDL